MRRSLFLIAALALSQAAVRVPGREAVDVALTDLSNETGFTIKRPVVFETISRAEVNQFLQERIHEAVKPAEIRAEELTLKKFGFVPQDFNLKKTTIDLLTEQTAAFYDFHRKKLYITDWASASLRDAALVHELAHALADQNFSLERFSKKVEEDSEKSLARQAVVEGQATWLMRALEQRQGLAQGGTNEGNGSFPVFDQAPLYFQQTLMFPYDQGEAFQQAVYKRMGKEGFDEVFRNPPVSAQQVIHPDLYFAGLKPVYPSIPEVKGMRRLVEGPVGELDHAILLRQYINETAAKELSPHWRGAWYRIYEGKKDKRTVLVYRSTWSEPASARKFFDLYQKILEKKWLRLEVALSTGSCFTGQGDDGYFRLELSGTQVTSREGFAEIQ